MSENCFKEPHVIANQPLGTYAAQLLVVQGFTPEQFSQLTGLSRKKMQEPDGISRFADAPNRVQSIAEWHDECDKVMYQLVMPRTSTILGIGWVYKSRYRGNPLSYETPNYRFGAQLYTDTPSANAFLHAVLKNGEVDDKVGFDRAFRGFWAEITNPTPDDFSMMQFLGFSVTGKIDKIKPNTTFVLPKSDSR